MTIRVGIIGTGLIGEDHGRKLVNVINGSTRERGHRRQPRPRRGGRRRPSAAPRSSTTAMELIAADEVDAVLVTSIGPTHAEFVLACIAAGKPVMCEKPLAPTVPECEQILAAEVAHGKRLVIVGYMRRYDPGYRQVKARARGRARSATR